MARPSRYPGSKATSATSESVVLSATTTYVLTCTGTGGTVLTVGDRDGAPATSGGGGGGSIDPAWLLVGSCFVADGDAAREEGVRLRPMRQLVVSGL